MLLVAAGGDDMTVSARTFFVVDLKTGQAPDLESIALEEPWAKGLIYCDMEGFALSEDGRLLLLDECGAHAWCPEGRFKIVWVEAKPC